MVALQQLELDSNLIAPLARVADHAGDLAEKVRRSQSAGLSLELLDRLHPDWQAEGSWTEVAPGVWGEPGAEYPNGANHSMTRKLDLRHYQDVQLAFDLKTDLETGYDFLHLEARSPGQSWSQLASYSGQNSGRQQFSLRPFEGGEVELRFRLQSDSSKAGEVNRISDFELTGRPSYGGQAEQILSDSGELILRRALEQDDAGLGSQLRQLTEFFDAGGTPFAARYLPQATHLEALELERGVGSRAAEKLLGLPGSVPDRISLFRACSRLSGQGLEATLELQGRLSDVDAVSLEKLTELALRPMARAEGEWSEREPGLWATTAYGNYGDSRRDSLVFEPIGLLETQNSRLCFSRRFELEKGYDFVTLQASEDGRNWKDLRRYTDTEGWQKEEIALSDYEGGALHLRFALTTDNGRNAGGFQLSDLRVEAEYDYGRKGAGPTFLDTRKSARDRALESVRLLALEKPAQIAGLAALASEVGDLEKALAVWPVIAQKGFAEPARLGPLLKSLAVEPCARLLPLVLDGPTDELEERVKRVQLCWQQARSLSQATAAPVGIGALQKMTEAIFHSKLDEQTLDAVLKLVTNFEAEGTWQRHRDSWYDSAPELDYRDNLDQSLTSREIDLTRTQNPVLSFEARFDIENNHDFVSLEVSDGTGWQRLKSFSGTSPLKSYRLPLSDFQGKKVKIRFRQTSDGSRAGKGFEFKKLRVHDGERCLLTDLAGDRQAEFTILEQLFSSQACHRELKQLEELTARLGSVHTALDIFFASRGLPPDTLEKGREYLALVARHQGPEGVGKAGSALARSGDLDTLCGQLLRHKLGEFKVDFSAPSATLDQARAALELLARVDTAGWQSDGWTRVANGWDESPYGQNYKDGQTKTLLSPPVRVSGDGLTVHFDANCNTEEDHDYVQVDYQLDDAGWKRLERFTGDLAGRFGLKISESGEQLRLRFTFRSDATRQDQGFDFRNLEVRGEQGVFFNDDGGRSFARLLAREFHEGTADILPLLLALERTFEGAGFTFNEQLRKAGVKDRGAALSQLIRELAVTGDIGQAWTAFRDQRSSPDIEVDEDTIVVGDFPLEVH